MMRQMNNPADSDRDWFIKSFMHSSPQFVPLLRYLERKGIMEQSDLSNGDEEEEEEKDGCSSCESGWTKYFSSSVHVGFESETECVDKDSADDEDGDSLASDASTGKLLRNYSNDDDDDEDEDETIAEEQHRRNLKVVKKTEYEKVGREDAAASDDKLKMNTNSK